MAQRLTELCTILIENAHGENAAQIFSTLADNGRSSLRDLRCLTRTPLRQLKFGLSVLIQHHMVLHFCFEEEDEPTYFQANWESAYALLRAHKTVKLVSDREGKAAGKLVESVLQLGHVSVGDLLSEHDLTSASKRDSGIDSVVNHMTGEGLTNGITKHDDEYEVEGKITSISHFHSLMRTLLKKGYLIKVGGRAYMSHADLEEHLRETVITEQFPDRKITGPKTGKRFNDAFKAHKRKWEAENEYSSLRDDASRGTIKKEPVSPSSNKRLKTNGGLSNGIRHGHEDVDMEDAEQASPKLPDDMFVRVNVSHCTEMLRIERIQSMVDRHLGPTTGAVFSSLLQCIDYRRKLKPRRHKAQKAEVAEEDDSDSEDEEEDKLQVVPDTKVLDRLDKGLDLTSSIKGAASLHRLPNGTSKHHGKRRVLSDDPDEAELGIKQEVGSESEDECEDKNILALKERNKRLAVLEMHLQILAELDAMVLARFGKIANRVVRTLREQQKIEDRIIGNNVVMRIKELRGLLTKLQFRGILDIQELPKDGTHQPNRTGYLWRFDQKLVQDRYLEQTYRAMARALQRVRVERNGKYKAVIEKAERSDVKGREEALLNAQEKEILSEWRDVEEQLLVQVARLDDLVALLRDFDGMDTSLTT